MNEYPPSRSERGLRSVGAEDPTAAEETPDAIAVTHDSGAGQIEVRHDVEWPAWAIVDWEALEKERSNGEVSGRVMAIPPPPEAFDRARELGRSAPFPGGLPALPPETPALTPTALARLPSPTPQSLREMIREASGAAQEARERAARAEGRAHELYREIQRLRLEQRALVTELSARRRWFRRRRRR